jgi:ATP-binding cassette subfamily B protein
MRQTIIKFTSGILIDLLVFITTISYIFFLSPSTGLLSLSAIPVFGLIAWHYNGKIIAAQRTVLQSSASTQSKYIDAIQRIEVIKTANTEQKHTKLIKTVYSYLQNQIYQLGLLGNKIGLVTQTFSTLILSGTLAWASFLVLNGNLLVGQMMAILSLIGNLIGAVSNISMANIDFQEARVAFVRMYEFAASEKEYEKDQTSTIDQSLSFDKLEIRNLNFRYPGKGLLLNDLNLTIGKGKIITIFGEVGCGKSTLISILQRFYPIESGEIVVDGIIWDKLDNFQWRNHIAVVSQQVKLFNQTIIENISLSRSAKEMEKVVAFCKEIGLHDFIIGFQQAYATVVNENGLNLSGGQQQLIGLARALYQRPQLLLLDEATAAMDRKTEQLVLEILNKLKHDMAIVIVTHRVQISRRTDYIYLIENRTSEIHGTHDELIQSDNIYKDSFEEIQIS